MTHRFHAKEGFTLIEIILVVTLTVFLFLATMQSVIGSSQQLRFVNAYQKVLDLVRQARSLAVSGKAQLDYTDYDQDGINDTTANGGPDYVTPAHYGVYFEHGPTSMNGQSTDQVVLFEDLHPSVTQIGGAPCKEGQYDPADTNLNGPYAFGCDVILETYTLPVGTQLKGISGAGNCIVASSNCATLFYSPIFADVSFDPALAPLPSPQFFVFGVNQGGGQRIHCEKIHAASGIPELMDSNDLQYGLCT